MKPRSMELRRVIMVACVALLAARCSTPSDFRPRPPGGAVGYNELQLTDNQYRVSFSGSPDTTRDQAENYLLQRAAEITLQAGYTHFVLTSRDVERNAYYQPGYPVGSSLYYPYGGYWSNDYWTGNAWSTYSAYAEITMLKTDEASNNPEAIDAFRLLRRLAPPPLVTAMSANLEPPY
jgi:hypothetical protein